MKRVSMILAALAVAAVVAACGSGSSNAPANAGNKAKVIMRKAVPTDYKDKKPPAGLDLAAAATIEAGKKLYEGEGLCRTCHGDAGKGDGDSGKMLDPKPTDLTSAEFQSVSDDYIFWRLSTLGSVSGPQGSGMTAFAQGSEEQRWQIVAYVRSLKGK